MLLKDKPIVQIELVSESEEGQDESTLSPQAEVAWKPGKKANPESEGSHGELTGDSGSCCPDDQMTQHPYHEYMNSRDDEQDEKQNIWRAS